MTTEQPEIFQLGRRIKMKHAVLPLILLAPSMFFCQDKPKETKTIDFAQVLTGYDHKPIVIPNADPKTPGTPLTLLDVVLVSLEMPIQSIDGPNPDPIAKVKRDYLASYIYDHVSKAELSEEDIALIVSRIKVYEPSLILGPAWKLLDPIGYARAVK
jgi:hypothetical protein